MWFLYLRSLACAVSPTRPAALLGHAGYATQNQVAIAAGSHLFPSRTEKLSLPAPMVLQCNAGEWVTASFTVSPEPQGIRGDFFCFYGVKRKVMGSIREVKGE